MISLQDTLKLNNHAVALYHSDNLPQAASAYYESLCFFNRLLQESYHCQDIVGITANTTTVPQHECLHNIVVSVASSKTCCYGDDDDGDTRIISAGSTQSHEPFVYQSPLILKELPPFMPLQNMQAMTIYCASILFNTAILHHQDSFKTGNSASLDRAAQLYEASLHLVGKFRATVLGPNKTVSLIAMAASNNLAQIEFEKGMLDQACKRLQFLKHLIQSLQQVVPHIFTRDEFEGMLSNSLSAQDVIASPAA
ncbi:unnamed protein product [Cylindrotheca closterium]|uniref:Uncharacterized protein n=1 Tax=Cylindrotheca closterium TaxID=2856 RepID=A0AAD2JGN1_9STRA|nr:unnamed protein product [Cylindrotheca closterium]